MGGAILVSVSKHQKTAIAGGFKIEILVFLAQSSEDFTGDILDALD